MADKKRIAMMGGTAACILATGFFMQGGLGKSQAPAHAPMAQINAAGVAPGVGGVTTPAEISDVALTAADTELLNQPVIPQNGATQTLPQIDAPVKTERSVPKPVAVSLVDETPVSPPAASAAREEPKIAEQCEITMGGVEMAGALVKLNLEAPCMPNERVTMHHNGMMFTEATDAAGKLSLDVPALAKTAVFIASFSNGEGAVANVKMTSMDLFDRAVVQSNFMSSIGLHALEFEADYHERGHIWANAKGDVADAAVGSGGFMTLLGNPAVSDGAMAQVYTFPSGQAEKSGDVQLSVEIEVTNANCGLEIEAQSLQVSQGGQPKVQVLDLTMPDCDAVGDFLVLKNLVNDLKVATNN